MIFSKNTLKLLHEAGWHKKRRTDTSEFCQILSSEGFAPSGKITEFLKRFGNLRIRQKTGDCFHFDISEAVSNVDPDWITENYSERAGSNLCAIGEAFSGYMVLCMSPKGEVYAGFDETLVYVGASGEEAVSNLCSGHELVKVPELKQNLSLKQSLLLQGMWNLCLIVRTFEFDNAWT